MTSPSDGEPSPALSSRSEGEAFGSPAGGPSISSSHSPSSSAALSITTSSTSLRGEVGSAPFWNSRAAATNPAHHRGQLRQPNPACSRRPLSPAAPRRACGARPNNQGPPLQGKTSARKPHQSVFWAAGPPSSSAARAFVSLCGSAQLCFPKHPGKPLSQTHVCRQNPR